MSLHCEFQSVIQEFQRSSQQSLLKERPTCQECVFTEDSSKTFVCVSCGSLNENENDDVVSDVRFSYKRSSLVDKDVLKLIERSDLGMQVQELINKNGEHIPNLSALVRFLNTAIKEVNSYRTEFCIKGKTPIKLIALIAINLSANSSVSKDHILELLELKGKSLSHTRAMLNEYKEQFIVSRFEPSIEDTVEVTDPSNTEHDEAPPSSDLVSFLKSKSTRFAFTPEELELADRAYDVMDRNNAWVQHTEHMRYRIIGCIILLVAVASRSRCDCEKKKKLVGQMCKKCFAALYHPISGETKPQDSTKLLNRFYELWNQPAVVSELLKISNLFEMVLENNL